MWRAFANLEYQSIDMTWLAWHPEAPRAPHPRLGPLGALLLCPDLAAPAAAARPGRCGPAARGDRRLPRDVDVRADHAGRLRVVPARGGGRPPGSGDETGPAAIEAGRDTSLPTVARSGRLLVGPARGPGAGARVARTTTLRTLPASIRPVEPEAAAPATRRPENSADDRELPHDVVGLFSCTFDLAIECRGPASDRKSLQTRSDRPNRPVVGSNSYSSADRVALAAESGRRNIAPGTCAGFLVFLIIFAYPNNTAEPGRRSWPSYRTRGRPARPLRRPEPRRPAGRP